MLSHMKRYRWRILLVAFLCLIGGCSALGWLPHYYRGAAFDVFVVDQDGKPLADVVVSANWELEGFHGTTHGQIMVLEATSDAEGRVHFPWWGPRLAPAMKTIDEEDPQLVFFKEGYAPVRRVNKTAHLDQNYLNFTRRSYWAGKTVALQRIEDPKAYSDALTMLGGLLEELTRGVGQNDCTWRQIPQILGRGLGEADRLEKAGYATYGFTPRDVAGITNPSVCGPLKLLNRRKQGP
jgi:hypothetical protein